MRDSPGLTLPRFYLHLRNGIGLVRDEEGRDLPDLDAARREAIRGIRSIIAAEAIEGRLDLNGRIDVHDGQDEHATTILYTEAFEVNIPTDPT